MLPAHVAWLAMGVLPLCSPSVFAAETRSMADTRYISVAGEGKATSPPDMATIYTGVSSVAPTASEALSANSKAMQSILGVLKASKVAAKDIQTSAFDVQPEYKSDREGRTQPEIIGYRVTNQVQIRVRNLGELGKVLDSLVQAGSNQISGIQFGLDDPTGLLNQARTRAFHDARSRAELYAQTAGVVVGKVLSISEQPPQMPRPMMEARMFPADAAGGEVPVATGEQELTATVHVTFALEDAQ